MTKEHEIVVDDSSSIEKRTNPRVENDPTFAERLKNLRTVYERTARKTAGLALKLNNRNDPLHPEVRDLSGELLVLSDEANELGITNERLSANEQFDKKRILFEDSTPTEFVHIKPEQQMYDVPVMVIPGWIATPEVFRKNTIVELAEKGREVMSVNPVHKVEADEREGYPRAIMKKVEALINTLDAEGIDQIDAIGHSEGGVVLAIAASLRPDKFRNLVLVNSAGMMGEDSSTRLTIDFTKNTLNQIYKSFPNKQEREQLIIAFREGAKAFSGDPVGSLKEVLEISRVQIHELLASLPEKGVHTTLINSTEDQAILLQEVHETLRGRSGILDGAMVIKGPHAVPYFDPRVAGAAHFLLHNMEVKRNKEKREKEEQLKTDKIS